jgi:hypothetical protein
VFRCRDQCAEGLAIKPLRLWICVVVPLIKDVGLKIGLNDKTILRCLGSPERIAPELCIVVVWLLVPPRNFSLPLRNQRGCTPLSYGFAIGL